jgi:carbonyl reductase 1
MTDFLDSQVVHDTLKCNYYGTVAASTALLPLIRAGGRLVNVSSVSGKLHIFAPAIANRFRAAKTIEDITRIMQDFQKAVDAGLEKKAGFPSAAYATSKAALTAATRVIAEEEARKGNRILINSCHPGYVNVSAPSIVKFEMLTSINVDRYD